MNTFTLVVDIGNTSTTFGLYRAGRVSRRTRRSASGLSRDSVKTALAKVVSGRDVQGAVLCSVAPRRSGPWTTGLKGICGGRVLKVDHRTLLGIRVTYPEPASIGADRLANATGAVARYGAPVIVADFGTALTFDVVSRTHGYIGGVIAPGLPLMFSYLAEKTELLPHLEPAPVRRTVGKTTEEAMRIGARYGYRGMVREILVQVRRGLKGNPVVCATGGHAAWVLRGLDEDIIVDPDLTLAGLGRIGDLNNA